MASRGFRADNVGRNRYEIIAQALLTTQQVKQVSVVTGIPLRTVTRIVADSQFQEIFKQLKLKLMDDAMLKLRNAADVAVDTLIEIMIDKFVAPAVRLAASCKVIELSQAADNTDRFADRLEKVEATRTINAVDSGAIRQVPESNDGWVSKTPDWKDQQDWQQ